MADGNYKLEKAIVVNLQGYNRRFQTVEKAEGFLKELSGLFADIEFYQSTITELRQALHDQYEEMLEDDALYDAETKTLSRDGVERLELLIEAEFYPSGPLLYPESKEYQTLKRYLPSVSNDRVFIAAFLGVSLLGDQRYPGLETHLRHYVNTHQYSAMQGSMAKAVIDASTAPETAAQATLKQIKQLQDDLYEHVDEHCNEIFGVRGRVVRLHHDLKTKIIPEGQRRIDELISNAKADVMKTVDHFKQHIASKEAVVYWADKRKESSRTAWGYVALSMLMLLGLLFAEYKLVVTITDADSALGAFFGLTSDKSGTLTGFLILLAVSLVAMFFVWPCRYFMASASSSFKYARYCSNKAMQIQTFLAMRSSGQIEQEQESLIVEKLFSDYSEESSGSAELPSASTMAVALKLIQGKGQHG